MSSAIPTEKDPGLRADGLGLVESVIMGVAGSGPAYSVAGSTATLIAAVGVLAPASLLYCSLIMFGVVFAFRHLNRLLAATCFPSAPAHAFSFEWFTGAGFTPTLFAGILSLLVMRMRTVVIGSTGATRLSSIAKGPTADEMLPQLAL